jgi:phosphate transport system permease protein
MDFSSQQQGFRVDADKLLGVLTRGAACVVLLMLFALIVVLSHAAWPSVQKFGLSFLTTSEWRSTQTAARGADGKFLRDANHKIIMLQPTYGALSVIYGTVASSLIALVLAIPPSLAAALFLVRLARGKIGNSVAFLIEFLAAIPSLAYGLWGMFVLRPLLRDYIEPAMLATLGKVPALSYFFYDAKGQPYPATGSDLLAGGLILAIMILPIITAVSRDVLRAVPPAQIEGTVALGATWWQSCAEMLKFSRSGLFGAIMLGLARAAGETMAVAMVIGINTQIKPSLLAPAQTMSTLLAVSFGEVSDTLERSSLVQVALVLLAMSLMFNIVARYLVVGKNARGAAGH